MTRVIGRRRWLARPAQTDDHRLVRRECEPRVAHMRCMRAHSVSRLARSAHIAPIDAAGDEGRDGCIIGTHAAREHLVKQGERLAHAPRAPAAVREQPAQQRRVRPHVGPQWVGIVVKPRKDRTRTPELPNGITWVTTGGAGGTLDTQSFFWRVGTWPELDTQISEFHFMHVNVVGSTMSLEAVAANGSILHSFSITP